MHHYQKLVQIYQKFHLHHQCKEQQKDIENYISINIIFLYLIIK